MTNKRSIPFTKMQGAGNDFVVLDNLGHQFSKEDIIDLAPKICDRNFGVGSDGILALFPPENTNLDYTMFYRNPDGSDAGMCGNGARCLALFASSRGFKSRLRFNVHEAEYEAQIKDENLVNISFPVQASVKKVTVNGSVMYFIFVGTEHLVIPVDKSTIEHDELLRKEGSRLRYHSLFEPKGTNVNFILGTDKSCLKLQTYERGVENLTLACGTGAIASALVWHHLQETPASSHKFKVETKGGALNVFFSFDEESQQYSDIKLEGPAHFVFEGKFLL